MTSSSVTTCREVSILKNIKHKLNFVLTQRLKKVTGLFRKGDCIIGEKLQVKFGVFHSFSFWVGPEGHFAIFFLSRFRNFFIILSVSLSVSLFPFFFYFNSFLALLSWVLSFLGPLKSCQCRLFIKILG